MNPFPVEKRNLGVAGGRMEKKAELPNHFSRGKRRFEIRLRNFLKLDDVQSRGP